MEGEFIGLNIDEGLKFLTEGVLNVFYQTNSFQSGVMIRCVWLPRLREWSLKKQNKSIDFMLSMAKVLLIIKFFVTLPQGAVIKDVKSNYFSRLGEYLNNPAITPKKYWWILRVLVKLRHNNTLLTYSFVKESTFFCKAMFLN